MTISAGTKDASSARTVAAGSTARGKCRERTRDRLPTIDLAPAVIDAEVNRNMKTPITRKAT
jgi:hypothetical protein